MSVASADGNDVLAVDAVMREAVARAREGVGPSLVVVDTYRTLEHCGPSCDDALGYRSPEEIEQWVHRCPLALAREGLNISIGWDDEREEQLTKEISEEIRLAFARAIAAPFPSSASATEGVYATPGALVGRSPS